MAGQGAQVFTEAMPAFVFPVLMGIVLLLLQYKSHSLPTTQVQRWGMALLAWLFLANGITAITWTAEAYTGRLLYYFLMLDLPVIAPMFLICFSLVYPQPIVRPGRIWMLFLFLTVVMTIIAVVEVGHNPRESIVKESGWGEMKDLWIYAGWMVSMFRWTMVYRKSTPHPEMSLISSILIWAVLFYVSINSLFGPIGAHSPSDWAKELVFNLSLLQIMTVVVIALIIHQLYERRGHWQHAEKLHMFMFLFLLAILVITRVLGKGVQAGLPIVPIAMIFGYFRSDGALTIIRPALIFYALLRFQFFGAELRAERNLIYLAALMMAFFGGLFISFFFHSDPALQMNVVVGCFVVLLLPSYWGAKRLIAKVIPSTRRLTRKEARSMYAMTLHTAIFKARITDGRDEQALRDLRRRLKIPDREHGMMLESERLRAREGRPENQIRYAIFVRDSGQHVASVGPMGDMDEAVLGGMLTAVRMFVKDAFGGSTGDLDTIQYGDQKLLMEWEKGYILTLDLEGEIDPTSRVITGDLLAIIIRRHWKVLYDWEGDVTEVRPVQEDLARLVQKYNKTGSF